MITKRVPEFFFSELILRDPCLNVGGLIGNCEDIEFYLNEMVRKKRNTVVIKLIVPSDKNLKSRISHEINNRFNYNIYTNNNKKYTSTDCIVREISAEYHFPENIKWLRKDLFKNDFNLFIEVLLYIFNLKFEGVV